MNNRHDQPSGSISDHCRTQALGGNDHPAGIWPINNKSSEME